jgi:hypothetical protein
MRDAVETEDCKFLEVWRSRLRNGNSLFIHVTLDISINNECWILFTSEILQYLDYPVYESTIDNIQFPT